MKNGNIRRLLLSYLIGGGRGTTWAIARDVGCGPWGVRDNLLHLENEGLVRRVLQEVRTGRRDCVRRESLNVWEWARANDAAPVIQMPDADTRTNARRAVLLRARESMGPLAAWAHAQSGAIS